MSDPLGRPPVDPMSEAAWSRVERGVWARLDAGAGQPAPPPPPRRWWLVALPIAAAAAIALVVLRGAAPAPGSEPTRVVAGAAPSRVSLGDAHVELDAATALQLGHDDGSPTVWIEHGAAWFTVPPRGRRPAFQVRAGDATVRVVGTRFRVARAAEQIAVEVEHGRVDVLFRGRTAQIAAHQRWSSDAPSETVPIAIAPAPTIVPVPAPAPTPTPTPTVVPAAPELPPAPTVPAPTVTPRPTAPRPIAPRPTAPPPPAAAPDDRAEYDRLAGLEARAPDAAIAGYLALARRSPRWADPALFAAARLAADRPDTRRAVPLLELYLQRFPDGANATDASQLLARLKGSQR